MNVSGVLKKVLNRINSYADEPNNLYFVFGIFGIITYPLYYVIWRLTSYVGYESLPLRLVVVVLCLGLALNRYWPEKIKPYLSLYWYFTLLYSLPFLFTYLLLKNNFSYAAVLNTFTVVVLSILLLELFALVVITLLGVLFGCLLYYLTSAKLEFPSNYGYIIITYLSVLLFGALFAHRKDKIQQEKLKTMKALGARVAHELRTPLGALEHSVIGIERYLPSLLNGYRAAKEAKLLVEDIAPAHLEILGTLADDARKEVNYSNMVIDMLIKNIWQKPLQPGQLECFQISESVTAAIKRYPFSSDRFSQLVAVDNQCDFICKADKLLINHVLFNLLKNAIYFIEKSGKGEIYISYKNQVKCNELVFKDTAFGIAKENLKKIFTPFFTTENHGSGLGLAFCQTVMREFGGDIVCESKLGEYTVFILKFPIVT